MRLILSTVLPRSIVMNTRFLFDQPKFFPHTELGIVSAKITSKRNGRIKFRGSYYPAQIYQPEEDIQLEPEALVTVIGQISITMLVIPLNHPLPKHFESKPLKRHPHWLKVTQEWGRHLRCGVDSLNWPFLAHSGHNSSLNYF